MAPKVFRFALGSLASPLSGLWRVWTHEDEVHATVRTTREQVTLTAYPTGRWRIALGSAVSRWTRPKEFRPGWTRGPDLVIPYRAAVVRSPPNDPFALEPVAWLPPPAPGHLARFTLFFASPRAEESRWRPPDAPNTQSVTVLPLRTAGTVHICRVDEPIAPEELTDLGSLQADAPPGSLPGPSPESMGFEVIVSADQAGRPSLRESYPM
jgi:hypothetical protein